MLSSVGRRQMIDDDEAQGVMAVAMTVTEKIIARHAHRRSVAPGELVLADVDLACADDVQFFLFRERLRLLGDRLADPDKVVLAADHYSPPSGASEAGIVSALSEFGREHGIAILADGIKHPVFIEQRRAVPGQLLVASDSHTNTAGAVGTLAVSLGPTDIAAAGATGRTWLRVPASVRLDLAGPLRPGVLPMDVGLFLLGTYGRTWATYKAIEWSGTLMRSLDLSGRMTLCNLTTEFGAKNGIVPSDEQTRAYAEGLQGSTFDASDPDAGYLEEHHHDLTELEPQVAVPPSPDNVSPVSQLAGTPITQAYIGSCTHGTLQDLRRAAGVLANRKSHPTVSLLVTPASKQVYDQALDDGTLKTLVAAGATICPPGCGSCPGMHQGTLAEGDVRISTQNRNFPGRSGHLNAQIYLASPETVAASAVAGAIVSARDL